MSDKWAAKSNDTHELTSIVTQIGYFASAFGGKIKNWIAPDWEQELLNCLHNELPVMYAYSFTTGNEKKYYVIIHDPTSANILNLTKIFYKFLDHKKEDCEMVYCEFLVFGEAEEKYLEIPENARKVTPSMEADYAGKNRTLIEVQA